MRAIWNRGHARDNTPEIIASGQQAFEQACREGAEPDEIIDAAKTWVAAADAPRYLPKLHEWLATRQWEMPPPPKRKRRGNIPYGKGNSRRNGNKVDLTRLALKMGGYVEDDDGNLYHPDGEDGCSIDWRASL